MPLEARPRAVSTGHVAQTPPGQPHAHQGRRGVGRDPGLPCPKSPERVPACGPLVRCSTTSPLYTWETRGTEPTPLPWACLASNWEVGFGHSGLDPHANLWSDTRCGKSRVGSQKGLCSDSLGSFPLSSEEHVFFCTPVCCVTFRKYLPSLNFHFFL